MSQCLRTGGGGCAQFGRGRGPSVEMNGREINRGTDVKLQDIEGRKEKGNWSHVQEFNGHRGSKTEKEAERD